MVRRCLYLDNFALQQKQLSWLTHEFATTIRQYLIGETEEGENAYKTADYFSSRMRLKRKSEGKVTSKIVQVKTWQYHPQSNGCLERFHGTLKSMLKGVGEAFPGGWDQLLPWVLFAYREVPVEGLVFSPFDIVFGRNIKGVLQLIKNSWLKDDMPEKVRSI